METDAVDHCTEWFTQQLVTHRHVRAMWLVQQRL